LNKAVEQKSFSRVSSRFHARRTAMGYALSQILCFILCTTQSQLPDENRVDQDVRVPTI